MRIPIILGDFQLRVLTEGVIEYNDDGTQYPCYMGAIVHHTHDVLHTKCDWYEEGMEACGLPEPVELLSRN